MVQRTTLPRLSPEVLAHAFGFLDIYALAPVSLVQREWRQAVVLTWRNMKELELDGDDFKKGFDAVF